MTGGTLERLEGEISLSRLMDFYDREKFWGYCRACPWYGTLWSCPPYEESALPDLARFSRGRLFCHVIHFSDALRGQVESPREAGQVMERAAAEYGGPVHEELLRLEGEHPGSLGLTHGRCRLCQECTRAQGKPCRLPSRMRLSLESLGFSVRDVTQAVFHRPILFSQEGLPAYQVLVTALLLP